MDEYVPYLPFSVEAVAKVDAAGDDENAPMVGIRPKPAIWFMRESPVYSSLP